METTPANGIEISDASRLQEDPNALVLNANLSATYDPDTDETDIIRVIYDMPHASVLIEFTRSEAERLGEWATKMQARYS